MHSDTDTAEPEADLVVAGRRAVAEDVVELVLRRPTGDDLPAWEPGAHVDLLLGIGLVRQYSLVGDPSDLSCYRIAVLREAAGRGGSAHVHDRLHRGTPVRVRGPRNHFPLLPAPRYLFLAGGIGITPLVAMAAAADAAGAAWHLVHTGRSRASMAYGEALHARHPGRVTLLAKDEGGRADLDQLLQEAGDDVRVYCCGPERLLAAAEERCRPWRSGTLHVERFAPRQVAPHTAESAFTVELSLSRKVVPVPPGTSILQAVGAAGVVVNSSCGEGTCGTCEVPILDGRADHRDALLTEEEREAGESLFICVSRALGDRLVLQL